MFSAAGGEAVVAAVAAGVVGLPAAFDPAALFHVVEQGIERGQGEFQGSAGAFSDLLGDFETVELLLGEQGEDGEFSAFPRAILERMRLGIIMSDTLYRNPMIGV